MLRSKDLFPYLVLAGAVLAAYANIYGNAFVADDNILIVYHPVLRSWHNLAAVFTKPLAPGAPYFRPLQGLLNLVVFQIAGLSLIAFHLPNVLLHAANACLVYVLGRKLGFAWVPAFLAALLWGLHPIQVEVVTQISGVADLLYSFFCLLAAIVLFPDFSRRRIWLAAPLMAASLLSKESAIIFPLLALICLLHAQKTRRFDFRNWLRVWPLAVTALVYVIVWVAVMFSVFQPSYVDVGHGQPHPFNLAVLATPFYYLKLLLWPSDLYMEHDLPFYNNVLHADVLAGIGLVVLAAIQILRPQSKQSRPLSWGLCWFIGAQLPTALFAGGKYYEHWLYLASAGLMLGFFQSVYLWIESAPARTKSMALVCMTAALIAAPVLGFLTWKQNHIWRNSQTFYDAILRHDGPQISAHIARGIIYKQSGEYEKAIDEYRTVVESPAQGDLSRSSLAGVQADWGQALLAMPKSEEREAAALRHYHTALEIDPDSYTALNDVADYYMDQGDAVNAAITRKKANEALKKMALPPDTM